MHLVQILLPLYDNDGDRFGPGAFHTVREELAGRFGGLTAFTRSPAEGVWEDDGQRHHDEVVVYEVMVERIDRAWWATYRRSLEERFRQEIILIRSQAVELL